MTKTTKLSLNTQTLRILSSTELVVVAGGYNSNGCGTAYSYAGQLTCNPDFKNQPSAYRCPTGQTPVY